MAALVFCAAPAQAFCPQLEALFDGGGAVTLPLPLGTEGKCSTALALSGATSTHCAWPFAYRAPEAAAAFEALVAAVPGCLDTSAGGEHDQDVNHPDFYDLRIFRTAKGEVGVSLKDKGGLKETYVFLRVSPNE